MKNTLVTIPLRASRRIPLVAAGAAFLLSTAALVAGPSAAPAPESGESSTALADWWHGKSATGNWFGVRDTLEDHGIAFDGKWRGTFYGITGGGVDATGRQNVARGAFDEEIVLGLKLDFAKLLNVEALEGLTATGSVRYRDGYNPNNYVGASSTFQPSRYQSGVQWRLMPFYLSYTTPELFGVKNLVTLSGGWQNPYEFFLDSPDSKLFTNNSIGTAKGLGANISWSSSYAAWGGFLKVKPTEWYYAMAGLYEAIPQATAHSNHGLDLAGYGPDPTANGFFTVAETGVTPKIGAARLPGKYAFGGYYYGLENTSYFGQNYDGKYGFYWQADQMLFRESSPEPLARGPGDGKSFKEPVPVEKAKLSEQGLYAINLLSYAPKYDNVMPFYFYSGLIYKGLIPTRDQDQFGVAFSYGNYSYSKIVAEEDAGKFVHQTYEAAVEIDYRVQLTKFAYVQPFWQYIIRPNGTGLVENANILGLHMGVNF
jgi:carbohydrate-selective porin OprB